MINFCCVYFPHIPFKINYATVTVLWSAFLHWIYMNNFSPSLNVLHHFKCVLYELKNVDTFTCKTNFHFPLNFLFLVGMQEKTKIVFRNIFSYLCSQMVVQQCGRCSCITTLCMTMTECSRITLSGSSLPAKCWSWRIYWCYRVCYQQESHERHRVPVYLPVTPCRNACFPLCTNHLMLPEMCKSVTDKCFLEW